MTHKTYTLSELTAHIREVMRVNFETPLWIKAEISELRENAQGHCYLEFIEKSADTDALLAKIKGTIWANTYRMLKQHFEQQTGQPLHAGLKVLVAGTVEFHEVYGLSLHVRDIDPTYTLGEQAVRRQEIIRQLEADGVMEMNKSMTMPVLSRRIAVISSATAAGYDDFYNQLIHNPDGYVFYTRLFPASMQGDKAEASIIHALDLIFAHADSFDVVVIIRGGGATTDLSCFDSYELALHCAQFPLPIISGIGHQRDLSIVDMVAHTSVKTPTAAAAFLIEQMVHAEEHTIETYHAIYDLLKKKWQEQQAYLADSHWKIKHALQHKTDRKKMWLENQQTRLSNALRFVLTSQYNKLILLEKNIERHSPAFMLRYGYTITTKNGKKIHHATAIKKGDKIRTYFSDGDVESVVD